MEHHENLVLPACKRGLSRGGIQHPKGARCDELWTLMRQVAACDLGKMPLVEGAGLLHCRNTAAIEGKPEGR